MRQATRRFAATLGTLVLSLSFFALLPGCNAVEGAGQDLQEASENTKEAFSNDD